MYLENVYDVIEPTLTDLLCETLQVLLWGIIGRNIVHADCCTELSTGFLGI